MYIKNFQDNKLADEGYDLLEQKQQMDLLGLLYELEAVEWILKLEKEHPNFEDTIKILKMLDENKGKKILGDLEKKYDIDNWTDSIEKDDWISSEGVELKEDMKVMNENFIVGEIHKIDDRTGEIFIQRSNWNISNYLDNIPTDYKVFVGNSTENEDSLDRTKDFEWEDLEVGMQIELDGKFGVIYEITSESNLIKVERETAIQSYTFEEFKEVSHTVLIEEKVENFYTQAEWTNEFEFTNLNEDDEIRVIARGKIGNIARIDYDNEEIWVIWKDGSTLEYSFKNFKKNLKLNITLKISAKSDLESGMTVKREGSNGKYRIKGFQEWYNGETNIIIEGWNTGTQHTVSMDKFKSKWKALKTMG